VIERKEGIMEGMRSRQATIDEGHMMRGPHDARELSRHG
jgi:hypothetical protein